MMTGRQKRNSRGQRSRRLEQERRTEALDNYDLVDISDRRPSDYWAIKEAREEYCLEYYDTPNC